MTIADRIQSLRKSKGMSQEELADRIGVSRQAVSKWESEQATPDLEKVVIMSDIFEVIKNFFDWFSNLFQFLFPNETMSSFSSSSNL